MKTVEDICKEILRNLTESISKHDELPEDYFKILTIIGEEYGEVAKAVIDHEWKNAPKEEIIKELYQLAAMCFGFLERLEITEPLRTGILKVTLKKGKE
ncbi:hypothetical protein LCGC14_1883560 [marine sediment metagenome]|uniref:NTP pyrophosphohydrolase MazG putative catalytic core domain-containing protein n=1 Tax=marine sediment metagenome TaxID=412755 RepID=A0A0F9G1L7_9ZZZZ